MMHLNEAFPKLVDVIERSDICQSLLPHAFAAMGIELHNREAVLRQASVFVKAGLHIYDSGADTDSQKMYEKALEIRTKLLGPEDMETFVTIRGLCRVYISSQQLERAEGMLTETLSRCQRHWGKDHDQTLAVMHVLALVYSRVGKFVDAEEMQAKKRDDCRTKCSHTRWRFLEMATLPRWQVCTC